MFNLQFVHTPDTAVVSIDCVYCKLRPWLCLREQSVIF